MKNRYVALLRGINVGGNNIIKMTELRDCLEKAGFKDVSTYIASGNVLFTYTGTQRDAEVAFDAAVDEAFGYKGPTVILSAKEFRSITNEAPKGFGTETDKYHSDVIFLKLPANPQEILKDVVSLKLRDGVDTAAAGSRALYFTRLSEQRIRSRMSKIIKLPAYKNMTIRSWNTTKKLVDLLESESLAAK